MKTIIITMQERWEASKTRVHQNKKKYNRKKDRTTFHSLKNND
jgi:hypothetical protein